MQRLHRLLFAGVVIVAGGAPVAFVVGCVLFPRGLTALLGESPERPISPIDLEPWENAIPDEEPVILAEVPADIRAIERNRRASRPADPKRRIPGRAYDEVLAGRGGNDGGHPVAEPAEPMPPTACQSVERVPKAAENFFGPHHVHDLAVGHFEQSSGFGFSRMMTMTNRRGKFVSSPALDRVELVSLLTDDEPSAYVLDAMATPALARQAKRRPLDEFEQRGLDAVRRGEHLVWTPEAPTRMFGAIRARGQCLECHVKAKRGDLLGAFTYYLEKPVDQLAATDIWK